jgi:hypothetical protein
MLIFWRMSSKPLDLPIEVAKAFVRDMRAFHAAKDSLKKDEIAAKQLWLLRQHWNGELRITDVAAAPQLARISLNWLIVGDLVQPLH